MALFCFFALFVLLLLQNFCMIALKTIASNIRRAAFITSSYDILIKKIPYFGNIDKSKLYCEKVSCTSFLRPLRGRPLRGRVALIPKKCLLGLCLECETSIRGVFCPNLFVCLCVCVFVCPLLLKKINNC